MGCSLEVAKAADGTLAVTGNLCPRGETYARQEVTAPVRMVTGLVRVKGTKRPLCVRTKVAIPKGKIPDVLAALAATEVEAPVALGDVVIADACGTGIPVVATAPFAG
jgi:CxxC motif-containing protein